MWFRTRGAVWLFFAQSLDSPQKAIHSARNQKLISLLLSRHVLSSQLTKKCSEGQIGKMGYKVKMGNKQVIFDKLDAATALTLT